MSFTSAHLFFDDVAIDQEWISQGRTITEADIVNFAGVSGDFNPIHVDHEFAKTTLFRKPIAHGMLVFSVSTGLAVSSPLMRTIAFMSIKEWTFKDLVFIGDTIRARSRVVAKEERSRGKRGVITWKREVVNQHDKIVQEGFTHTMVEGRAVLLKKERDADKNEP